MWIGSMRHHRCLVPARGFYEWRLVNERMKVPYFIHPKNQDLFSFAGLYSVWNDVEDRPLYSFSILTTRPNKEMKEVHDRMPVILHPAEEATWLDRHIDERKILESFLGPYEDGGLDIYRVSDEVNSPRNNDRHLVDAIT
jgi:putative SOS response-associated peptidase YedK